MSMVGSSNLKIINGQYKLKKRISSGSFGDVYLSQDIRSKEYQAVKIERQQDEEVSSVDREVVFLQHLVGTPCIPRVFWAGRENKISTMVIQFLGRDLTYFLKQYRKFSIKCVLNIADQLLTILENVHKRNILHRDIKPENVLVGRDHESDLLYLVDFGISKFYRDSKGAHMYIYTTHISIFKDNKPFIGTTRYASIAAHKGQELSRRDDLESLGYMLIYMLRGTLAWQNLQSSNEEEKIKSVGQMKMKLDSMEICNGLPLEFARYLDYVRKLSFSSQPDYKYLQSLFKKVATMQNVMQSECKFDWASTKPGIMQQQASSESNNISIKRDDPISLLLIRYRKDNPRISKFGSQLGERESGNSLLKPDSLLHQGSRKNSLSPNNRDLNARDRVRKLSANSVNDSYGGSVALPGGSVMVGFQASMISAMSKQQIVEVEDDQFSPSLQPQKKQYDMKVRASESRLKNDLSQEMNEMNEEEVDVESKYGDLQDKEVHAHFKESILKHERSHKSKTKF